MEIRTGSSQVAKALAFQLNALRDAMVGSNIHGQVTLSGPVTDDPTVLPAALAVTAPDATNLATSITLANDILRVLNTMYADTAAHKSAVTAQLALSNLLSTDILATVQTRANALKTSYEGHRTAANVHFTNDTTNTITAANATDQTTLNALLIELKGDINAHILAALAGQHVVLTPA